MEVKAFGMNHSEQILRLHKIENDYIQKPIIPGIECVGAVYDFKDIREACMALDSGKENGKIVVTV